MSNIVRSMQPITLEIAAGEHAGTYSSRVLDVSEGEEIVVAVPLERGSEVRVTQGTTVILQIPQPDGLWLCPATVVETPERGAQLLRLGWPAGMKRIQRRRHVRIALSVRAEVLVRGTETADERLLTGLTEDLSASGVKLSLSEELAIGAQARLTLHLPELGEQSCEARVVRSGEREGAPQRFWCAFEFVGALDSLRAELSRLAVDLQREQQRKDVA